METYGLEKLGIINAKAVYRNLTPAQLTEHALCRGEGTLSNTGALVVKTGKYTGRSANDKFIVDTPAVHDDIAWGKVNRPIEKAKFDAIRAKVIAYLQGKEIEVDAVCDGTDILIPGIMEHIERAGVHSGDSISVYPAQSISQHAKDTIVEYTKRLARSLHVIGMINIQFIVCGEDVYVIEVNPRSSRTVPYISKVTGIPIVPLATKVILGHTIRELGYEPGLQREAEYIAIKMPVFSFEKIRGADIALGPEMKSTGECLGIAKTFNEALYKAFIGAGIRLPKHKQMIITVKDEDKEDIIPIAKRFEAQGYRIFATRGTANVLTENGIKVTRTNKLEQPSPNLMDLILGHKIDLVIDTPSQGVEHSKDGFVIRRNAIETGVNVLTSLDTATALVTSLENTDVKKLTLIDIATIDKR